MKFPPAFMGVAAFVTFVGTASVLAGPYSAAKNDPGKADAPVPGFTGPDGNGVISPANAVNPLFLGWATGVASYQPAPGLLSDYMITSYALGPVTGDPHDVTSLGDLSLSQINLGAAPGTITLTFDRPITDRPGADFVVFENGLSSNGGAGVAGQLFGELAYVEVSSNGTDFVRFPSISNTPSVVGEFGTIDPTNVFQLAGKHTNFNGISWGTPFDLSVLSGLLDIDKVTHVRIVDIPGDGSFTDSLAHPIYDAWLTQLTGGFDLEALGVISHLITFDRWQDDHHLAGAARGLHADADGDGVENCVEYGLGLDPTRQDASALPTPAIVNGHLEITFVRDTRKTDVTYVVQSSSNLHDWNDIARSVGGEPTTAAGLPVQASSIAEESASALASVEVRRRVTVANSIPTGSASWQFLRLFLEIAP